MAIQKLKTVFSTGAWINSVKTFYTKINEIIDYLNGSSGEGSYKKYVVLVTQAGVSAPTATVLENTTNQNFTFSRSNIGQYSIAGNFNTNKTAVIFGAASGGGHLNSTTTSNSISFQTLDTAGTPSDECLSNTYLEIRLYNE